MKTLEHFILPFIILLALIFFFSPVTLPENIQLAEVLDSEDNNEVIVIFNSGGWGNTPLEETEDLAPIVRGIESTLNEWGYKSIVVPYNRTKDGFFGKITGIRELLNSFKNSSKDLANKVELIAKSFPNKKIVITGLSNGASFVSETYEKISEEIEDSVYAVAVGTPFWTKTQESDNILQLSNNGKDTLVEGKIGSLLLALVKAPFIGAFRASGHEYSWSSPDVNSQIVAFLEDKFVRQ